MPSVPELWLRIRFWWQPVGPYPDTGLRRITMTMTFWRVMMKQLGFLDLVLTVVFHRYTEG